MTIDEINYWTNRTDVLTIDEQETVLLHEPNAKVIISLGWAGRQHRAFQDVERLLGVQVATGAAYDELRQRHQFTLRDLYSFLYVLVNADHAEHAVLFQFDLDTVNRVFTLHAKLNKRQVYHGHGVERDGFEIFY